VDIPKVKLQAHRECKVADWELAIHEAREDAIGVFTDGSMGGKGNVGAGWYVEAGIEGGGRETGNDSGERSGVRGGTRGGGDGVGWKSGRSA